MGRVLFNYPNVQTFSAVEHDVAQRLQLWEEVVFGATWGTQGQVCCFQSCKDESRPCRCCFTPEAVVIRRWQMCPEIKKHEVVYAGAGHRFVSSETSFSLIFPFTLTLASQLRPLVDGVIVGGLLHIDITIPFTSPSSNLSHRQLTILSPNIGFA